MERWEIIEKWLLGIAAVALTLWGGWAIITAERLEIKFFGFLGLLFAYWLTWQALYEDRLDSRVPPTMGERLMFGIWVWGRRLILGSIALLLGYAAIVAAVAARSIEDYGMALLAGSLSGMAGWVALFGGGINRSMGDDRRVHEQRTKRYEQD
jgi:hypothetical protein